MSDKDMRGAMAAPDGADVHANAGQPDDEQTLEQALRGAYEAMDPSPEAEARMLAALKAAQAGKTAGESASTEAVPIAPETAKRTRRRIAPWKVALPAAACLALAAIGVGVAANAPGIDTANQLGAVSEDAAVEEDGFYDAYGLSGETPLMTSSKGAESESLDLAVPENDGNTEEYSAIEEAPFTATATSPLSTVSADVDTASYANLRRMLMQGYALDEVPAGAVRIEEMLNYFDYGYASPAADERFSMQARVGTCPWSPETQLLVLGFATAREVADKPANLVFLIDVSGSMDSPDKLELLQDSFATLLEHLDADDRVSIVTYSGQEEVVLEGAAGDADKEILRAIYRLRADGSTNGEAGLKMAYEVAQRNYIEGGVNRIVMASDGDLNVGMTSESDLYDFVSAKRDTGIYLSVLGFGAGNYKDNKMETLADHGNGQYHYIDCIDEAERVLSRDLAQSIVPFADDVKVQVEFNPATVKGYRLIGYENRTLADSDFLDDAKDAGDMGPNAQFTVAYEIVPAGSALEVAVPDLKYADTPAGAGDELATCSLRYRSLDDGEVHQQQLAVTGDEGTDGDWDFAAAVVEFGMLARDSQFAGDATLEDLAAKLSRMQLEGDRAGLADLVKLALANAEGGSLE